MNRLRNSKTFIAAVLVFLSAALLQAAEFLAKRSGLELRTAAQMVKGIYVWLIAPVVIFILLCICVHNLVKGKREGLRIFLMVFVSLGILFTAFCRGFYYMVLSEEYVLEKPLEGGFLEGYRKPYISGTYRPEYYETVGGIFRRPFEGWSERQVTARLEERYRTHLTLVSSREDGMLTYTAESIRPGAEPFTFQADRNYDLHDNFMEQLMKSDAAVFWENQGVPVFFVSMDGEVYELESDRADTARYPGARDQLMVKCWNPSYSAARIVDWLVYVMEDERYFGNDRSEESGSSVLKILISNEETQNELDLSDTAELLEEEGWETAAGKLTERLETELAPKEAKQDTAAEIQEAVRRNAEQADALFVERNKEDYEKECVVGDGSLRYRMVVMDAACGHRAYSLLKSTDGGDTWEMAVRNPFDGQMGMGIDFTFLTESFGFATLTHNGGDDAVLYVTEDGGQSYEECVMQGVNVVLDSGYLYSPYDYPEMPYEEDGKLYVLCGQGLDGDYDGGDERGKALFSSADGGHTFLYEKIVAPK